MATSKQRQQNRRQRVYNKRGRLRLIGLPWQILSKPKKCQEDGEKLLQTIKQIEKELTEWEAKQDPEWLKLLPWYEAREQYKKEGGTDPTWYEALYHLETAYPKKLTYPKAWGKQMLKREPKRAAARLETKRRRAARQARGS